MEIRGVGSGAEPPPHFILLPPTHKHFFNRDSNILQSHEIPVELNFMSPYTYLNVIKANARSPIPPPPEWWKKCSPIWNTFLFPNIEHIFSRKLWLVCIFRHLFFYKKLFNRCGKNVSGWKFIYFSIILKLRLTFETISPFWSIAIYNPLLTLRIFIKFFPAGIMSNMTKTKITNIFIYLIE